MIKDSRASCWNKSAFGWHVELCGGGSAFLSPRCRRIASDRCPVRFIWWHEGEGGKKRGRGRESVGRGISKGAQSFTRRKDERGENSKLRENVLFRTFASLILSLDRQNWYFVHLETTKRVQIADFWGSAMRQSILRLIESKFMYNTRKNCKNIYIYYLFIHFKFIVLCSFQSNE